MNISIILPLSPNCKTEQVVLKLDQTFLDSNISEVLESLLDESGKRISDQEHVLSFEDSLLGVEYAV